MQKTNRLIYADLLRILATFGVLMIHTAAVHWASLDVRSYDWQIINFYDSMVRWAVPIFIMLSGMFFLDPTRNVTVKNIFTKSILRMFIALICWGMAYRLSTLYIQTGTLNFASIIRATKDILMGKTHYHLWFLYTIMGLYVITPILRVYISNASKKDIEYFLILAFIFTSVIPMITLIYPFSKLGGFVKKFNIRLFSGFIGFYVAGYYYKKYTLSKKVTNLYYIFTVIAFCVTWLGTSYLSIHHNKANIIFYDYLTPNVALCSVGIFIFFKNVVSKINFSDRAIKYITKLSSLTFGIYLVHVFFNMLLGNFNLTTSLFNPLFSTPLLTLLVFILSSLTSYIIHKIPILNRYLL